MQFGNCPVDSVAGALLGHSVRVNGTTFRKGRVLTDADIAALRDAGLRDIVVARIEPGDIPEDEAAQRIASLCGGSATRAGAPFTGRANLYADVAGLAVVDAARVRTLNLIHPSITVATVGEYTRVSPGQMVATIKIIPFAVSQTHVEAAEALLRNGPLVRIAAFAPLRAALISTMLRDGKPSLLDKSRKVVEERLNSIGSDLVSEQRVPHNAEALAAAIRHAQGADLVLIFGASAIADRRDVVPTAIEAAGGAIDVFGMPVDPGNLLLTGRLGSKTVIGLPGCARSPKLNGFDWVLWRVAAGLTVGREEIAAMGVGGLLGEIPTRPQPRDERPTSPKRRPIIAGIVLAAGLSSRMGSNKLLVEIDGKPLVRRAAEAALASAAHPVLVVTGSNSIDVRRALSGLDVQFVDNPEFSKGLSTSLKHGLSATGAECDGAVILLGDMPDVTPALIDRMIAAFDPDEGRAICVATRHGKRGNPVLWAKRFFPEMMALRGDVGAKHLVTENEELVCEVEAEDDGPLIDVDTPEALAAYRNR